MTLNSHVQEGVTLKSVAWAFGSTRASNWHPLTWLSHMLDWQLYEMWAGGHHLTNLLLHAANTVLLFLLLRRMTAALWRSAFVAALFALHPLHVESVAWVSERKDVLSRFFVCWRSGLRALTSGSPKSKVQKSKVFYGLALLFFALGLMSKPMLVTLPFVLLLLDYWPLRRIDRFTIHDSRFTIWRLVGEKLPFLLLTVISCAVTLVAQHEGKSIIGLFEPFIDPAD